MFVRRLLLCLLAVALSASSVRADEPAWETLPDGSSGQETQFTGVGGVSIPAYVRKPRGPGPFPTIVLLHGGRYGKNATVGFGRSTASPVADLIAAGWAIYSIDYRPNEKLTIEPIENDDSVLAVKVAGQLPFVDARRIGLLGGSHGGNVISRMISRVDVSGAVLCAPAAFDLIGVKKAAARGEPVVGILFKLIDDLEVKHLARAEDIEKDPAKFHYSSAMTEVDQVRCPLLIVNGRNDDNSPTSTIDAYVGRLRAAGKQVETYLPDNGPHGFYFGRPEIPETKEAARRIVAFFKRAFSVEAASKPAAAPATTARRLPKPTIDQYGAINWVDPDRSEPSGTKYQTFHSKTIDAEVSYLVYLPPEYDQQPEKRYSVLYYLHASGGTPRRDAEAIVQRFDEAIRGGRVPPLVIVFANGLRGATMYCDSKDGKYPVESVIVNDLVPHVDATYRTIASRAGRALEGFSMGGYGAAHLGFKFPEVFGVVSIMAPPLLGPELKQPLPVQAWSRLFPAALGSDLDYYHANDPFDLVVANANALRDRSVIRIVTHIENENWLAPRCEQLHKLLADQTIPHTFHYLSNVKSHNRAQVLDTLGDSGLLFFASGFDWVERGGKPRRPPAVKAPTVSAR